MRVAYCVLRIAYCVLRIAYCGLRIANCGVAAIAGLRVVVASTCYSVVCVIADQLLAVAPFAVGYCCAIVVAVGLFEFLAACYCLVSCLPCFHFSVFCIYLFTAGG